MDDVHNLFSRLRAEPGKAVRGIAAASGVRYATLRNWREGRINDPRSSNVAKLRLYYETHQPPQQ